MSTARVSPRPFQGLGSMIRYQFRYTVLHPAVFTFSIGLPAFFYLMFGAFQDYASVWNGHSNVSAQVMFAMGAYGTALSTASVGAQVGVERGLGWGRQLALTPMRSSTYLLGKIVLSLASGLFSLLALMIVGVIAGAEAEGYAWVASPLLVLAGCVATACMGVATGYLFRSDAAYTLIGGISVVFAFFAGMFVPLDQLAPFFTDVAPYTPLHGVYQLSQWPLKDISFSWLWIVNIAAWTALFGLIALMRMRRDTSRR